MASVGIIPTLNRNMATSAAAARAAEAEQADPDPDAEGVAETDPLRRTVLRTHLAIVSPPASMKLSMPPSRNLASTPADRNAPAAPWLTS